MKIFVFVFSSGGGGDHDDHDSAISPYLTPTESKLFATAAGSFNFSMAALAGDPSVLGGKQHWISPVKYLGLQINHLKGTLIKITKIIKNKGKN